MLEVRSIDEAMGEYEWIIGEPVDEKAFTISRTTNSTAPDSIYTAYRVRIVKRLGRSKHPHASGILEKEALKEMPVENDEVLVLKSGGNAIVDGILLKKRGSPCFSELLPRPFLLALAMDTAGRTGWLEMGCRAIYSINGDQLIPRDQEGKRVTVGMKEKFADSLAAFSRAFTEKHLAR